MLQKKHLKSWAKLSKLSPNCLIRQSLLFDLRSRLLLGLDTSLKTHKTVLLNTSCVN